MSTQLTPCYDPLQTDMFNNDPLLTTTLGPITGNTPMPTMLDSSMLSNGLNSGTFTITSSSLPQITIPNNSPWNSMWITTDNTKSESLRVKGDANFEGNIKVKGVDLMESLQNIEKRLNILRVNKELEERWEELRELGEKYRALEQEIITREEVWNALKS